MKQGITEGLKTLVAALVIAVLIHALLFEPFWIPSGSMVPTLLVGDEVMVDKFAYGFSRYSLPFAPKLFAGRIFFHAPKRGDVVVFIPPNQPGEAFVKRLIGLPGDTVQVTGGQLLINGVVAPRVEQGIYLDDSGGGPVAAERFAETLPGGRTHDILKIDDLGYANNTPVYAVPAEHYFLMGDSRDNSEDSRFLLGPVGFVPAANLLGPAVFILGSVDLHGPVWAWPGEVRWGRFFRGIK